MEAKTDWTNNSSEMKRKRNRAGYEDDRQSGLDNFKLLVAMRFWETPVHIPNTMVKTKAADDTILVTVWESRWLPDKKKKIYYIPNGGVAQLGEHLPCKQGVKSSNLSISIRSET